VYTFLGAKLEWLPYKT